MVYRIILSLFITCMTLSSRSQVVTSSTPLGVANLYSTKYQVTVSQNGRSYTTFTYVSTATGAMSYDQQGKTFSYSIFSFSQPVTIQVVKLNSSASSATIRPNRLGLGKISAALVSNGSSVQFTLSKPAKLTVEFDDDPSYKDVLLLFADSLEQSQNVPNTAAANVYTVTGDNASIPSGKQIVYFTPGVHTIGFWNIPTSVTQVYLADGCFVRGYFYSSRGDGNGPSLMINGRGIISNDIFPFHYTGGSSSVYNAVQIQGGHNHVIEGITITDASAANIMLNALNCSVDNVNINGFQVTNDGITTGDNTCSINNCFLHVNDDCLVLYGGNISITNNVIWQMPGGSIIQLGWRPNTINGINLINSIDVIHAEWSDTSASNVGFINAMNSLAGSGPGLVQNFTVSNIYFDTNTLRFLDIRMIKNGVGQPTNFSNFAFSNVYITTSNSSAVPLIYLSSYDATHKITGFTFQNIFINNQLCLNIPFNNDFVTTDNLSSILFIN